MWMEGLFLMNLGPVCTPVHESDAVNILEKKNPTFLWEISHRVAKILKNYLRIYLFLLVFLMHKNWTFCERCDLWLPSFTLFSYLLIAIVSNAFLHRCICRIPNEFWHQTAVQFFYLLFSKRKTTTLFKLNYCISAAVVVPSVFVPIFWQYC